MTRGDLVETLYAWAWASFPALCPADRGLMGGLFVDLYIDGKGWGLA